MQPIPIVACFGEFLPWLSSSAGFKSGDWLGQSKTFHLFALINSLTELAGCSGSLFWCNMKHFPNNMMAFSWILVGKMVLYSSKLILLLLSYIKSSVKLRRPVPEAAMHAHAMTPPPPCFTDEAVCFGIICSSLFSPQFCFPITQIKVHLCLIGPKTQLQNSSGSPLCFLANSNLAFLFLVLIRGVHLAVQHL